MYLTTISNVPDHTIVWDSMTNKEYTAHLEMVYQDVNGIVSGGGYISYAQATDGTRLLQPCHTVFSKRVDNARYAKLASFTPPNTKREFLMGFAGQFLRVEYRGADGIKRERTIKTLQRYASSVPNNPLCWRVYDASVKGFRTLRLDRLLAVKFKDNIIQF